jgi:hypothetical protein
MKFYTAGATSNLTFVTGTTCVTTFVTTSTATTGICTFPKIEKTASPPSLRLKKGDPVRVTAKGFLHGRSGLVQGFMTVRDQRLAFVGWSEGGWATFLEEHLESMPEDE